MELDDVEPVIEGVAIVNGDAATRAAVVNGKQQTSPATAQQQQRVLVDQSPQRRKVGPLKFIRTADGKGYMRRQTDNLLQKAKATAFRVAAKKKRRRFFRGANYRFDGKRVPAKPRTKVVQQPQLPLLNAGKEAGNEDNVMSYLGLQRKNSSDVEAVMEATTQVLPKAKKSFRSSSLSTTNDR